jgi:hypothetical protein
MDGRAAERRDLVPANAEFCQWMTQGCVSSRRASGRRPGYLIARAWCGEPTPPRRLNGTETSKRASRARVSRTQSSQAACRGSEGSSPEVGPGPTRPAATIQRPPRAASTDRDRSSDPHPAPSGHASKLASGSPLGKAVQAGAASTRSGGRIGDHLRFVSALSTALRIPLPAISAGQSRSRWKASPSLVIQTIMGMPCGRGWHSEHCPGKESCLQRLSAMCS